MKDLRHLLDKINNKINKVFSNTTIITDQKEIHRLKIAKEKLIYNIYDILRNNSFAVRTLSEGEEEIIEILQEKVFYIDDLFYTSTTLPDIKNDKISLYKKEFSEYNVDQHYRIFKNDTKEYLGYITYSNSANICQLFGNIGYGIVEKHRGNNYSLSALELLSDILCKQGIYNATIYVHVDNIASQKIAEKFGGKKINSKYGEIIIYNCNLSKIKQVHYTK